MSEPAVILWWGSDLRLLAAGRLARRDLAPGEDPVEAILETIGREFPGKGPVRVIFQPDSLQMHEVPCPKTDRRRLGRILSGDYPALANPAARWSVEPVRPTVSGFATVLHLDPASRLPDLAAALARRGRAIEGAWPLLTLLENGAAMGGGGRLSVVATDRRALVAGLNPAGDRCLRFFRGDEWAEFPAALRLARARFEDTDRPGGWLVLEEGPAAAAVRAEQSGPLPEALSMAEFLARARFLAPSGFGDLMPRPRFSAFPRRLSRRSCALLALGVFTVAAAAGWRSHVHRTMRRQQESRERVLSRQTLEAAAAEAALQKKKEALFSAVRQANGKPQAHYRLLIALSSAAALGLRLRTLDAEGLEFTLSGEAPGGIASVRSFATGLFQASAPWRARGEPALESGGFTLGGRFAEPEQTEAPASATEAEERLAAIRSALPTAEAFESVSSAWETNWTVASLPPEEIAGIEIRHLTLVPRNRPAQSWTEILDTVRSLCGQPGLGIDRLALAAGGDGALQAALTLTARLRR